MNISYKNIRNRILCATGVPRGRSGSSDGIVISQDSLARRRQFCRTVKGAKTERQKRCEVNTKEWTGMAIVFFFFFFFFFFSFSEGSGRQAKVEFKGTYAIFAMSYVVPRRMSRLDN